MTGDLSVIDAINFDISGTSFTEATENSKDKPTTSRDSTPAQPPLITAKAQESTSDAELFPWNRFPPSLLKFCKDGERPTSCDRQRMVNDVAQWLFDEKKKERRADVK